MIKKKITVYDIAKEAGVSPATVSRVLTSSTAVSSEKREIVEKIIKKYDFLPNVFAQGLSKNETKTIGFILPDITNPFFSTVFLETEKHALCKGYTLFLCNSMSNTKMESTLLKMLTVKQVDAIIFMGGRVNNVRNHPRFAAEIKQIMESTPIMMVNGKMAGIDCYNVVTDEKKGMSDLIEYLISLGHTKIGMLGGRIGVTSSFLKYNVFRKKLSEHGLICTEEWIIPSGFSIEGGVLAMEQLLKLKNSPTAVIGSSDLVSIGIIRSLHARHIKVPDDMSVAGFDGSYLSTVTNPQLTTVSQNYEELGIVIMDAVLDAIRGRKAERQIIVDTKLIIRDSCKAV